MKINKNERWIQVDDYYLVSNLGRWFSLKTLQIVKQNKNNKGYLRLNAGKKENRTLYFTHIKVVEMFGDCKGNHIPPGATSLFELGLSIDHVDGNKNNNKHDLIKCISFSTAKEAINKKKGQPMD